MKSQLPARHRFVLEPKTSIKEQGHGDGNYRGATEMGVQGRIYCLDFETGHAKIAGHLNAFGEDGWELVAAWPEIRRHFFKRPKLAPGEEPGIICPR